MRRARSEAPLKYRMQYAIIAAEDDAMEGHAMKVTRMLQPYTVIFAMGMLSVSLLEGLVWQRSKIPVIALLAVFVIWIFVTLPTFGYVRITQKGVLIRNVFGQVCLPWENIKQVGKHTGITVIDRAGMPKYAQIFVSCIERPWAGKRYRPDLGCFWKDQNGKPEKQIVNFAYTKKLERAIRKYWPGEWVYLSPSTAYGGDIIASKVEINYEYSRDLKM